MGPKMLFACIFVAFSCASLNLATAKSLKSPSMVPVGYGRCNTDRDCWKIKGSRCHNINPMKTCDCPKDHILNHEGTECLPIVSKVDDACEFSFQCLAGLYGAYCYDNKCRCLPSFQFVESFGECIKVKKLGEHCNQEYDTCYQLSDSGVNTLVCTDEGFGERFSKQCGCGNGYTLVDGKCIIIPPPKVFDRPQDYSEQVEETFWKIKDFKPVYV